MCHGRRWHDWELLRDEEQDQDEEPRLIEVTEPEAFEPEPEREPERELIRA